MKMTCFIRYQVNPFLRDGFKRPAQACFGLRCSGERS